MEVLKLNKPEWPHIAIGCLASIIIGAALPIYSIIFGNVVGVSIFFINFFPNLIFTLLF